MAKHKLTNTSGGARYFHKKGGTISLDKGRSWTGELSDEELKAIKDSGTFAVDLSDEAAPPPAETPETPPPSAAAPPPPKEASSSFIPSSKKK